MNVLLLTRYYRHVASGQIHKIISHQKQEQWEGGKELIVTLEIDFSHSWLGERTEFFKEFQVTT